MNRRSYRDFITYDNAFDAATSLWEWKAHSDLIPVIQDIGTCESGCDDTQAFGSSVQFYADIDGAWTTANVLYSDT